MKKILSLALACLLMLSCFAGCAQNTAEINADAVLQHLLADIQFDTDLTDTGDHASIYFAGLPAGATVRLYISSTGYFPDEVAMITLASEQDANAAKTAIDSHLEQIHNQFHSYIPEELPKIEAAVTWQSGKYIFVVIAPDASAVNALFSKAHTLTPMETQATQTPATEATVPPTTEATVPPTTEPAVTEPPETEPPTEPEPTIPTLTSESGTYSLYAAGIVRVDNAAFEPYRYYEDSAAYYASLISTAADTLAGEVNVYCLPVPTAVSVTFPDDVRPDYPLSCDQNADIIDMFSKMSSNVIGVNCHPTLMEHREEYLYYRTDYHWNGPAAYYAYETFCKTKGITPYTMEERDVSYFEGFLGFLYYAHSGCDPILGATPDTVIAYHPVSKSATMVYQDAGGALHQYPIIQDVTYWGPEGKYLCYAAGDNAYTEFTNPEVTDGSVLVVVKESYGNVLMSYLVDHYSTIYEIDYRYWRGDITQFCRDVGANDLLFANNMTMICSGVMVGTLATIIP